MAQVSDNLGRFIQGQNIANLTLNEIKGLLSEGLSKPVGPAKPIGKATSQDPAITKLTELFQKFTSNFQSDVNEQKKYLQRMINVLSENKKKKEETKNSKSEKNKSETLMEKFAQAGLKKGSIYTHDISACDILIDIKNVLEAVADKMGATVKKISDSDKKQKAFDMIKFSKTIGAEFDAANAKAAGGSTGGGGGSTGGGGGSTGGGGGSTGGGGGSTGNIFFGGATAINELLNETTEYFGKIIGGFFGITEKSKKQLKALSVKAEIIGKIARDISSSFLGIDDPLRQIFDGVIVKERELIQNTRAIAYEIEGATKSSKSLNRSFEDIGKTVALTGKSRQEFAEEYTRYLKNGVKDTKTANKLAVAQLNTETQLGLKAGQLGDTYQNMFMHLKLNTNQISDMGRGMRDVARNTGLTGEAMQDVVKSSESLMKIMRNTGTLTTGAFKNVMELQANFKKVGIEGNNVTEALLSTNKLLAADGKLFGLLAVAAGRAGMQSELLRGSILKSKKGIKGMSDGLKSIAQQFGLAGNTADELRASLEGMSDERQMQINVALQSSFGVEAGELISQFEAIDASSKTLADRLKSLNEKKKQNLTLEEKANIAEEERKLKLSKSMEVLTALDKAASSAKNMGEALSKFSNKRGEFEEDLNALGVAWTNETDVARGAITNALNSVNKQLRDTGKSELKIDSKGIEKALKDPIALRELTAQINKAEQEASTAAKAQLDPASSAAQSLKEINDSIRNLSNTGLSAIFNSALGQIIVPLVVIGGMAASLYEEYRSFAYKFSGWIDGQDSTYKEMLKQTEYSRLLEEVLKNTFGYSDKELLKKETEAQLNIEKHATNPGSIYTHDTRLENLVTELVTHLKGSIGKATEPKPAMDMDALAKSALKSETKPVMDMTALAKGAKENEKALNPVMDMTALAKGAKENEKVLKPAMDMNILSEGVKSNEKALEAEKKLRNKEEKLVKKESILQKIRTKLLGQEKANAKEESVELKVDLPETDGNFISEVLKKLKAIKPQEAMELGAILAGLAAGLLLVGAGIMFLGNKIINKLNLDLSTVTQTAAVIGAIGAAATAISYAAMEFAEKLQSPEIKEFLKNFNYKEILSAVKVIGLLGPAMVLFGAGIIKLTELILSNLTLNIATITETVAVVTALGAAATAITLAGMEFIKQIESKEVKDFIEKFNYKELIKPIIVLSLLGPAMVLLGATIIKLTQMILSMYNLDPSTIGETAATIAALGAAVAGIAVGLYGALKGLEYLGKLPLKSMAKNILVGSAALLFLSPLLIMLAATVLTMSQAILGSFNLDSKTAMEVGLTVSAILLSAAMIAVSCIGAMAGLWGLGALAYGAFADGGLTMLVGAAALTFLTPIILLLGATILEMSQMIIGSFDLNAQKALEVGLTVAAVLISAAFIAGAITGAMFGLYGLGLLVPMIWANLWVILAGASALVALTPAIVLLASAILSMSDGIIGGFGLSYDKAVEIGETVASVILSAAAISGGVLASAWALSSLGTLIVGFGGLGFAALIGLMALGGLALLALTPAILSLGNAIISMSAEFTEGFDKSEADKISEAVDGILSATASISLSIISAAAKLSVLGLMAISAVLLSPLLLLGYWALKFLMIPIYLYAEAMTNFYKFLSSVIDPSSAKEMGEGIADILGACGIVTDEIMKAKDRLLNVPLYGGFWLWSYNIPDAMCSGVFALENMMEPIVNFVYKVVDFAKKIGLLLDPKKSAEMGKDVGEVLASCGIVTDEIMKAKDRLVNIPLYGGFWLWSYDIPDAMWSGVFALENMMEPIVDFVYTVVDFAKKIGRTVDPKKAVQMGRDVADILSACATVSDEIMKIKDKLIKIEDSKKYWFLGARVSKRMEEGNRALKKMMEPTVEYVGNIVEFSKQIGTIVEPKKAAEMGKGVAAVLGASGSVTEEILKTRDKLKNIDNSKSYWGLGQSVSQQMTNGTKALSQLMMPVYGFIKIVVAFSKTIGTMVEPSKAVQMGKGAAEILGACGTVTDEILKSRDRLKDVKDTTWGGWGQNISDKMKNGAEALKKLIEPVKTFVSVIVEFSKTIGTIINPSQAVSMGKGVASIFAATGQVADDIKKTKDKLISFGDIKSSEKEVKSISQATISFSKLKTPLIGFMNELVNIAKDLESKTSVKQSAKLVIVMTNIGKLVQEVVKVVDIMTKQIMPLTDTKIVGGASTISRLEESQTRFRGFFRKLADFIKIGIVDEVRDKFKKSSELRDSANKLKNMATIIQYVGPVLTQMKNVILPLTDKAITSDQKTMAQNMEASMKTLKDFFGSIAKFIMDGIVTPVSNLMADPKSLSSAAKKLSAMAVIITQTGTVLKNLGIVMQTMDPGFYKEGMDLGKIVKYKDQFASWFGSIAEFINVGIIGGAKKAGDPEELKQAAQQACLISSALRGTAGILTSLGTVMQFLETKAPWEVSPMKKIYQNKELFAAYFAAIATFVRTGIVDPINNVFGHEKDIVKASTIMIALAKTISSVPPVLTNLGTAINMLFTGSDFYGEAPIPKINKNKEVFGIYFKSISEFIRDGIVNKIREVFADTPPKKITEAASIMRNLEIILISIPKVIKGMVTSIDLMGEEGDFDDSSIGIIMKNKEKFGSYFRQVAAFLRDGVVNPIVTELQDIKSIRNAAMILGAMNTIVTTLPRVINGTANGLIPLVESEDLWKDAPLPKIIAAKDEFTKYLTQVAIFLRDGIVKPIITELPDVKTIRQAATTLYAMNSIINLIPTIINSLSKSFGLMTPDKCFKDSPIAVLASNVELFSSWFYTVATFMRNGIINPIFEGMITKEEIEMAYLAIDEIAVAMKEVPKFIDKFSVAIYELISSPSFDPMLLKAAITVGSWFYGIAHAIIDGIINPIKEMPDSVMLEEVNKRLGLVADSIVGVKNVCDKFSQNITPLLSRGWVSESPIETIDRQADLFQGWWNSITGLLTNGIINPIVNNLPSPSVLEETNRKIGFTSNIISEVHNTLTGFSEKISPLLIKSKMPFGKAPVQTIDSQLGLFKGWWDSITVFLKDGIINPIMNNLPNTTELTEALLRIQLITQVMESIKKAMSGLSGTMDFKSVDFGKMNELIKNVNSVGAKDTTYSGSGGSFATDTTTAGIRDTSYSGVGGDFSNESNVSAVPPLSKTPGEQVKQELTTNEPNSAKISSPELRDIATETHTQTELNKEMVALLTKLVAAIGTTSNVTQTGGQAPADTSIKKVGSKPFMNTKWPYGAFMQTSGKQVGNIGSGTI